MSLVKAKTAAPRAEPTPIQLPELLTFFSFLPFNIPKVFKLFLKINK